jgi:hypothetical protein
MLLGNICQQESDLKERFKMKGYERESGTLKPKKLIKKSPCCDNRGHTR